MKVLDNLRYTENHEWVLLEDDSAIVGITDYAQSELGDIVYVEIDLVGQLLGVGDVFGSVEAVKTVSDLFMPITGKVIEVNPSLEDKPELVNEDPYGEGWIIKIHITEESQIDSLLSPSDYKNLIDS